MKLRKFFGATSRAVLQQVRAELGPDAMIVANRATANGIEITAMAGDGMDGLLNAIANGDAARAPAAPRAAPAQATAARAVAAQPAVQAPVQPVISRPSPVNSPRDALAAPIASAAGEHKRWEPPRVEVAPVIAAAPAAAPLAPVVPIAPIATAPAVAEKPVKKTAPPPKIFTGEETADEPVVLSRSSPRTQTDDLLDAMDAPINRRVMEELASMRGLLENQLAQIAWTDSVRRQPLRAKFMRELLASGYSAALARELTQRLPDDYTAAQAEQWLISVISKNIICAEAADDIVSKGGVYALTGPTGVGKTTTTAKLAARCAVHYGASQLALLTTDSYRVGAQDQLRIYAKILGITVQTINDTRDLRQALDSLKSKHLVLIDTVGIGQRDHRVGEQAMLLAQPEVKRLLLLNATSQAETLDEVIAAYRGPMGKGANSLAGCVMTKVDEAARLGQALDVLIRHQLPLNYISNGQRVPEDLYMPNATYLAQRSFKANAKASPYTLKDDEFSLMMGNSHELAHV